MPPAPVTRRKALRLSGAMCGAILAGCTTTPLGGTNSPPSEPASPTTEDRDHSTPTRTTSPPGDADLTVEFDALQPAVVMLDVDYLRFYAEPNFGDHQYLYLDVTVDAGPPPSLDEFAFRFDGKDYAPLNPIPENSFILYREWMPNGDPRYQGVQNDTYQGWVVFELPETGNATDAEFVWPGGTWQPTNQLRTRLAAPLPPLTLEEWRVLDTVPVGSEMKFGFTVGNKGSHDGRFVAGINGSGWQWPDHGPVALISRRIPAGEATSWETTGGTIREGPPDRIGDGEPDIRYELFWPDGTYHHAVQVVAD